VCGFGTAFALHFTERAQLSQYRDTLADNRERLANWIRAALERGIYLLPDGRIYLSTAHTRGDVECTIEAAERVFARR
jgi:glutamate-1-semialdehyde 2,1-aminomutase